MQKIIYRKNDYESPTKKHNMGENRLLKDQFHNSLELFNLIQKKHHHHLSLSLPLF